MIRIMPNYVVVLPEQVSDTSSGGKIITLTPKSEDFIPERGMVLAYGGGGCDKRGNAFPDLIKVGETVRFILRRAPQEIEYDGLKAVIMKDSDIVGVY